MYNRININKRALSVLMFLLILCNIVFISPAMSFAEDLGLETPGVLRVGMEANYAPFNWSQPNDENGAVEISNSKGEYANGYDVAIAKIIADKLDLKLEIVKSEWDGLPVSLTSGKTDVIIAGMSPTEERKKMVDFTDNYYTSDLVIVVQKDGEFSDKKSIQDFKGAKITGQLNTFHYSVIDQIDGVEKQTALENFPSMISALKAGKIDGYVSERPGAMAAVASNDDLMYITFEEGKGFEANTEDTSIAIGTRKDSPLTGKINEILSNISEDERQDLMEKMVSFNTGSGATGFFNTVKALFDKYSSIFLKGAATTMVIAIFATLIGFFIGIVIAVVRSIKTDKRKNVVGYWIHKVINFILLLYVEIFRGTPMMVQSVMIYYGGKQFLGIDMSPIFAGIFIVSINTGAYLSEVVRGGINSIDEGQSEACKAIGMTHSQAMRYVILPQAIKNILPSIGNEFVINIKDTSVLNVISVTELFFMGKSVAGTSYEIFESYFIIALIYLVLTFTVTRIILLIEKKLNKDSKGFVMESSTGGRA